MRSAPAYQPVSTGAELSTGSCAYGIGPYRRAVTVGDDCPMTYISDNRGSEDGIPPGGGPEAEPGEVIDFGRDTGALLAAVPALLGFQPENSMVLIGLSAPSSVDDHPAGVNSTASVVGPVIRADLGDRAVASAAEALSAAQRGRSGPAVIIVVVGGDAGGLVAAAARVLGSSGTQVLAAFTVTDLCAGALWWEVPVDGSRGHGTVAAKDWLCGSLPDPASSPVAAAADRNGAGAIVGQQEFDSMLDPVPLPLQLVGRLPASWDSTPRWEQTPEHRVGRDDPAGRYDPSVADVCRLVDDVGGALRKRPPEGTAQVVVRQFLGDDGVAARVAAACDREDLLPVLVVLATGPGAPAVTALLTETSVLSRGLLRHRALALLAVVSWCSSGGVLAHRAARRVLDEAGPAARRGRSGGGGGGDAQQARNLRRSQLTLAVARQILRSAGEGRPAPVIRELVDRGLCTIDEALHSCPPDRRESFGATVGRVLDRHAVSVVRNELDRRAER